LVYLKFIGVYCLDHERANNISRSIENIIQELAEDENYINYKLMPSKYQIFNSAD